MEGATEPGRLRPPERSSRLDEPAGASSSTHAERRVDELDLIERDFFVVVVVVVVGVREDDRTHSVRRPVGSPEIG